MDVNLITETRLSKAFFHLLSHFGRSWLQNFQKVIIWHEQFILFYFICNRVSAKAKLFADFKTVEKVAKIFI
jgi:hypothetical protein